MIFWVLLALMTAAVVLVVIAPLARPAGAFSAIAGEEARVYRDQLDELERDRERGLIGGEEAEAARTEIGRRLLAATRATEEAIAPRFAANRFIALAVVVAIPAVALSLYLVEGQPDMHDAPLAERLSAAPSSGNITDMIGRVEKHLAANPADLSGWRVIAPIYARMGRLDDAVKAWGRLIAAGDAGAENLENYGAGLVDTNDGIVSPEAQSVLARAVAADPDRARARFYYAEGLRQAGSFDEALQQVDELIRRSPADAPWLGTVRKKRADILAALKRPLDTPEPATLPAVGTGVDRATIEGMVNGLAARLAADPNDRDGWIRLMRSYLVLGRPDKAKAALSDARKAFAADADALAAINAAAEQLGVDKREGQ